ncbi:hypothetical protein TUST1-10_00200 [Vibrio phage ICP1_2004_A]|jgi:hypothetical protein|nr:hypothetical protein TUST1-191_00205 [Vibrio phage ICP1_2006_D]ADX88314.1 hypothetical protein TUST1-182_00205 [Vibrio phage ICP1_2006_C]ADX88541.1 hypothetical protein TUST1-159_00205 [Vibrio phage ICP1_2006_B]ADX88767.1 hypothetical protein TUST1-17_00205 [Vibrio phage ICP1_2006_A]ADX88993.1 hypothetical protein TUST1-15_00205 [Vibrio phage ICP1_2005_A]ADX89225.1 hypothetical protein TUST1-2_00215 [Vibrio phage ICP1_2001_A]ADX89452.1 hypothetical protein TUST1-10_00200 [Vibrio phage ICP1
MGRIRKVNIKPMDTLSISHRTSWLALNMIKRVLSGEIDDNPELMLSLIEDLHRLEKAYKLVDDRINRGEI